MLQRPPVRAVHAALGGNTDIKGAIEVANMVLTSIPRHYGLGPSAVSANSKFVAHLKTSVGDSYL